ncbi:MAG: hypothetical protein EXS55_02430 [Candidatus Magasanikbacteria bacterium]|nr:hypothetical protein [Candidatus Magasanikbacteria bacterium]
MSEFGQSVELNIPGTDKPAGLLDMLNRLDEERGKKVSGGKVKGKPLPFEGLNFAMDDMGSEDIKYGDLPYAGLNDPPKKLKRGLAEAEADASFLPSDHSEPIPKNKRNKFDELPYAGL